MIEGRKPTKDAVEPRQFMPLIITIAAIVAAMLLPIGAWLDAAYERAAMGMDPSAERAYLFAERHFDATKRGHYDIDRAERLFNEVAALDPMHPSVFHELARISFLRGDFESALSRINFQISMHDDSIPSSLYVKGLIEGYMGRYADAARDYERYLEHDPQNWAALNDYAWTQLKAGQTEEAKKAAEKGLIAFPRNAWLLNTYAIALYELGYLAEAQKNIKTAAEAVVSIKEADWLLAYPGNDPAIAREGIETLRQSIAGNMHTIQAAIAGGAVESE